MDINGSSRYAALRRSDASNDVSLPSSGAKLSKKLATFYERQFAAQHNVHISHKHGFDNDIDVSDASIDALLACIVPSLYMTSIVQELHCSESACVPIYDVLKWVVFLRPDLRVIKGSVTDAIGILAEDIDEERLDDGIDDDGTTDANVATATTTTATGAVLSTPPHTPGSVVTAADNTTSPMVAVGGNTTSGSIAGTATTNSSSSAGFVIMDTSSHAVEVVVRADIYIGGPAMCEPSLWGLYADMVVALQAKLGQARKTQGDNNASSTSSSNTIDAKQSIKEEATTAAVMATTSDTSSTTTATTTNPTTVAAVTTPAASSIGGSASTDHETSSDNSSPSADTTTNDTTNTTNATNTTTDATKATNSNNSNNDRGPEGDFESTADSITTATSASTATASTATTKPVDKASHTETQSEPAIESSFSVDTSNHRSHCDHSPSPVHSESLSAHGNKPLTTTTANTATNTATSNTTSNTSTAASAKTASAKLFETVTAPSHVNSSEDTVCVYGILTDAQRWYFCRLFHCPESNGYKIATSPCLPLYSFDSRSIKATAKAAAALRGTGESRDIIRHLLRCTHPISTTTLPLEDVERRIGEIKSSLSKGVGGFFRSLSQGALVESLQERLAEQTKAAQIATEQAKQLEKLRIQKDAEIERLRRLLRE